MAVDLPHLAVPFRFAHGKAAVVEQDSPDDVAGCVWAIVKTPLGQFPDTPELGMPDEAFSQGGPDLDEIRAAIVTSEPRAHMVIGLDDETLAGFLAEVTVELQ